MKTRRVGVAIVGAMTIHLFSVSISENLIALNTATDEGAPSDRQYFQEDTNILAPHRLSHDLQEIYQRNNVQNNLTLAPAEFLFPESPLYDKTLPWDSNVNRLWMTTSAASLDSELPPAMILLTSIGWNQANQSEGSKIYRGMRLRQLMDGVINHQWFHPTAYEDINEGRMEISNTTRYYIFIDSDMCGEKNFPKYGRGEYVNADRAGRGDCCRSSSNLHVDSVMHSTLVRDAPHAKVMVWECAGIGPFAAYNKAQQIYGAKLTLLSLSASQNQLRPGIDQGLPSPVVNPCNLTDEERRRINECDEEHQHVLVSFSGMIRWPARNALLRLHNGNDILVFRGKKREVMKHYNETDFGRAYHKLFKSSLFGACPRGDNLFSYRLAEQMSCGVIPVVYADDWVFPFDFALLDWEDAVVLIREEDADRTPEILLAIPNETRCIMRRKALEFYDQYLKDGRSVIRSIVQTSELQANRRSTYTASVKELQKYGTYICPPNSSRTNSPLTDKTLCWDYTVDRHWLRNTSESHPSGMLLLTHFGWCHRKPKQRLRYHRSIRTRELVEGIVNHPWFSPQSLAKVFNGNTPVHPNITYYIFLDLETCGESNYPIYDQGMDSNSDTIGGRSLLQKSTHIDQSVWSQLLELPDTVSWKLIYWDCENYGPSKHVPRLDGRTAMASISARESQATSEWDQGLPFPPYRRFVLSSVQRAAIKSCDDRSLLLYFSGGLLSRPRRLLQRLHNGIDVWVGTPDSLSSLRNKSDSYFTLAVESSFCAVPRGIRLGSSRLVEMMSAGCIPVIIADRWVLPIQLAINWTDVAVIVPEIQVLQTTSILRNIAKDAQCEMRKRMLAIYDRYLSTGRGTVKAIASDGVPLRYLRFGCFGMQEDSNLDKWPEILVKS